MVETKPTSAVRARRLGVHGPVWLLTIAIAAASVASFALVLGRLDPPSTELEVPWWALAAGFAVVESFAVHLHFRSESGSFSLLEIPLVFGLLFAQPQHAWIAIVLGASVGLLVIRRQQLLKVAFNVANLSLHLTMATLLFTLLLGDNDPLGPLGWLALIAATATSSIIEVSAITMVIALTEGESNLAQIRNVFMFGSVVSSTNTVQALIAALVVTTEPLGALLFLTSTAVLFTAYRAYVGERDSRERIEFLYNSTRALRNNSESTGAVSALLDEATTMFRSTTAEFYMFTAADAEEPAALFTRYASQSDVQAIDNETEQAVKELAAISSPPRLVTDHSAPAVLRDYLEERGLRDAMFGTLRSESRTVGLLIVADRLGNVSTFTAEDLRLFENLVDQSAVALENDQLEQALVQLRELEQELAYQARYDTLTGLANRALFATRLEEELPRGTNDEPVHVLYIDLDDFKLVNDTLGHAAGDLLLREVAQRIRAVIRPSDIAARLGGDEFAVLLSDSPDPKAIAHRIIDALTAPFLLSADEVRIGASVGLATVDTDETATQLLQKADLAMYAAKERGKGSVVTYSEQLQRNVTNQQALQSALRKAISEKQFEVRYQPIVRLSDQRIVGAEALVRWRHSPDRLLAPSEFIDEAERSGLITSVDKQVRAVVLEELSELLHAADDGFFTSLNLSAKHLQQPALVDQLASDILAAEVPSKSLVLEITESALVRDIEAASEILTDIRALGVRLALDDFGTGYSSLSYLRHLPIDLLKIAQPFVMDISTKNDSTFVEAITNLSHTLGFEVVAEGIETEPVLKALQAMNCDLGQGFYFARPLELTTLLQMLGAARPLEPTQR